jgi:hypothetical protein
VDGIQVHKVMTASQSKSKNVWIENSVCTHLEPTHWLHF